MVVFLTIYAGGTWKDKNYRVLLIVELIYWFPAKKKIFVSTSALFCGSAVLNWILYILLLFYTA